MWKQIQPKQSKKIYNASFAKYIFWKWNPCNLGPNTWDMISVELTRYFAMS